MNEWMNALFPTYLGDCFRLSVLSVVNSATALQHPWLQFQVCPVFPWVSLWLHQERATTINCLCAGVGESSQIRILWEALLPVMWQAWTKAWTLRVQVQLESSLLSLFSISASASHQIYLGNPSKKNMENSTLGSDPLYGRKCRKFSNFFFLKKTWK